MPKIVVDTVHTNPITRRGDGPTELEHTDRVERLLASGALVEVPKPESNPIEVTDSPEVTEDGDDSEEGSDNGDEGQD